MISRKAMVPPADLRLVVRRFLVIFLPVAVILAGILAVFYYTEVRSDRTIIESVEDDNLHMQLDIIEHEFQLVVADLMVLSEQNELLEMLESGEAGWREALAEEWLMFSTHKEIYDQIRFLDETGMEVVRVNYNDGNPVPVPDEQLAAKAERYYFEDILINEPGEVFVSPLDLNIEHGEIEQPLKPTIRFGITVSDSQGQIRGVIILNYLAVDMLHHFEATGSEYSQIMLLNSDGYWLKGSTPEDEWGFMLEDRSDRTFGNDFPEAWQRISASESGQFYNGDGMFTYETVYPLLKIHRVISDTDEASASSAQLTEGEEYYWKLVSYIAADVLSAVASTISGRLLLIYAAMVALLAGGAWAMSRVSIRNKLVEERLRKAEKGLLNIVFQTSTDAMRLLDTDFKVTRVNPVMTALSGLEPEAVIGNKCQEIFNMEICNDKECLLNRALETKTDVSTEAVIEKQDGTKVACIVKASPIIDEHGVIHGVLENFVDITERKRAENALSDRMKEQQCLYSIGYIAERPRITLDELYQEVVNLLPSGWQYPEDTCARITIDGKEFKTANCRDTQWKQSSDIIVDGGREGVVEVNYLMEKPELDEGPFLKEERLLIDAITERLALSIKRKQMKEELEQKVAELQDAYQKLRELDRMKDNFLSTVSHELRTPLTSIKGFAEILLDYEEDRETQREFLTIINNESERLTRLIDDFLDLARIEAGRMNWQDTTVAIAEAIKVASNATLALSAKKTLTVDIALKPDLPTIWGDRDRIVQVMSNLLSNAIKFTPEGGKIRVGAEVIKDSQPDNGSDVIRVSVCDTGIGIAPKEHQAVFEKFLQAGDTLTDKPRGTGLGLPICKEIIEHYGGRIWVESEAGRGSTFYFTLPVAEKAAAARPKAEKEKAEITINDGRTILVVDDEAPIRRFLNYELTSRGYRVIEASGGKEAIALAREHHPDLITLDVLMPDIDGLDVTAVLKSDPDTREIPILILSVVEEKEKGYRLGVSDYVTKPFSKRVLMGRITRLLGQARKTILVVANDRALTETIKSELESRGFFVYVANDGTKALKVAESKPLDLIVLDTVIPKVGGYEVMRLLKDKPDTAGIPIIVLTDVEINRSGVEALSLGAVECVAKSGGLSKLFEGIENILGGKLSD